MRGNLVLVCALVVYGRSIPACAGEPYISRMRAEWSQVYPRVCGGTVNITNPETTLEGLSPRVRGNRHHMG